MGAATPDGLVGRQRELTCVSALVHEVAGGEAAAVLIEGEAGIGKSVLVRSMIDFARDAGVAVFRADAHPFERTRPFGPIARALDLRVHSSDPRRASIGRLLAGDGGAAESTPSTPLADVRYRVVEEIADLVETACARAPALLVIEDLHWADESTLVTLRSLVHGLGPVPLLLVGSLRPSPRRAELDQLVDESLSSGARLVRLQSLAPAEVEALVHAQLGLPPGALLTSIVAKAGGNPLWVVEIVRSLATEGWLRRGPTFAEAIADELPDSLHELVLRRLRYLSAPALELLRIAAVLGDAVSVHDVAAMARRSAVDVVRHLDEAFRARLLDERADALVFRHQLVHDAIYQDLPQPVRRAMHRDAAGVLERAGADLVQVAGHLVRGADPGDLEAVRLLRQVAGRTIGAAPAVAVELLRRARSLLPAGHDDADRVAVELVGALQRAGQVAEASDVAEAVLAKAHDADIDVPLRLALVSALSLQNRTSELIDQAEAALVRAPGLTGPDRALLLVQASYGRTFAGDVTGGEATARRALGLGARVVGNAMTVWSLTAVSVAVKTQGRYAEALRLTRRAVALAFDPVDPEARLRHPHFFLAMALSDSDRVAEARRTFQLAIQEYEELGSSWLLPDTLLLSAELRFHAGEWDDCATELESGLHLAQQHGQRVSVALARGYQALMAAAKGDDHGARAALADVTSEFTSDVPCYGAEVAAFAGSVLAEAHGQQGRAFEVLLRFWDHDSRRQIRYYHRYLAPALVRLGLALDQRDVACRVAAEVEAGAVLAAEVPTVQSAALRCRGLVDGDPDLLVEAVALAHRGHRFLDHAGACEDAAAVLIGAGRESKAKELLVEAQARYEAVDARAWAARAGAGLRRLGVRQGIRGRRHRPSTGWESLTPNELAVCRLVAEGLTNREVGRRLYVSPHTVNTHLRHVFQKLSVSTRTELAGLVAGRSALR